MLGAAGAADSDESLAQGGGLATGPKITEL